MSPTLGKMQIRAAVRCHFTPMSVKQKMANVGEGGSSKIKSKIPIGSAVPLLHREPNEFARALRFTWSWSPKVHVLGIWSSVW
jgi:hypothetical protein